MTDFIFSLVVFVFLPMLVEFLCGGWWGFVALLALHFLDLLRGRAGGVL